ncbi:MAG: DUF4159 domain-containing protein [Candidatus Latescibacteria bacterium]|nr:DUF4159 domain-containing protein [Candidatus Latescibacterota bacterium]
MRPRGWILVGLLAMAQAGWSQSEERPPVSVPEPKYERARSYTLTAVDYPQSNEGADRFTTALPELTQFFNTTTDIKTKVRWNETRLSDKRILQTLLLYMTGNTATLQISSEGKKNLGEYLKGGGLLFGEDIRPIDQLTRRISQGSGLQGTPFDRQFKALIKDPQVLGGMGGRWQRIPKSHDLYSSYWDFPDGPPLGGALGGNVSALEMIEVRGRVAVIFSDLNISLYWADPEFSSRDRGLQLGTNLIVFAMTQQAAGRMPGGR